MTHIHQDWHFWSGTQFMASDESTKQLHAFKDADACINWLFLNGHKDAARSLNQAKRDQELVAAFESTRLHNH